MRFVARDGQTVLNYLCYVNMLFTDNSERLGIEYIWGGGSCLRIKAELLKL